MMKMFISMPFNWKIAYIKWRIKVYFAKRKGGYKAYKRLTANQQTRLSQAYTAFENAEFYFVNKKVSACTELVEMDLLKLVIPHSNQSQDAYEITAKGINMMKDAFPPSFPFQLII